MSNSVAIALNGGRVTAEFRAAVFAAAGREGTSVNEFVLRATAKVLLDRGAPFSGIFDTGDVEPRNANPYPEGGNHNVQLIFGPSPWVQEREKIAITKLLAGRNLCDFAVSLMLAEVERKAAGRLL